MNSLKTTFLYHAILLVLLIILLAATLLDRYPTIRTSQALAISTLPTATPVQVAMAQTQFNVPTGSTQTGNEQLQVEIRAEVVANGNARAQANASGPGDAVAKADTDGPGNAQAKTIALLPKDTIDTFLGSVTTDNPTSAPAALPGTLPVPNNSTTNSVSAIVNGSQVNLRAGPGLNYAILGVGNGGERYTVIGKSADQRWWQICCFGQQSVWIAAELANIYGPTELVPTVTFSTILPTPTSLPILVATPTVPAAPAQPPALVPTYGFRLTEQTQFEERIMPRLYLFVTSGVDGVAGYTLRVRKDGTELPAPLSTFGGTPQITWGQQSSRQRYYNLKLEYPGIVPAGLWEVQLLDASGREAGPPVQFRLNTNEANQEMYLRYDKLN